MQDEAWRAIRSLASKQYGRVARTQAENLGCSRSALRAGVERGVLIPERPGLYALPGASATFEARAMGIVVMTGGCFVSHQSGGHMHGLIDASNDPIHVVVEFERSLPDITGRLIHRTRSLLRTETRVIRGVPVTSVERTILDMSGCVPKRVVAVAVDESIFHQLTSLDRLGRYVDSRARSRRKGAGTLREVLWDRGLGVPQKELERRFDELMKSSDLPRLRRQTRSRDRRIDFAYPDLMIGIELDGAARHQRHDVFVDDRRRQNELLLDGWLIIRFTWEDVTQRTSYVIDTIRRAIRTREKP